eukprot:COSAG02_NODE_41462_length_394_cov_1.047458_1_plen_52_part_10
MSVARLTATFTTRSHLAALFWFYSRQREPKAAAAGIRARYARIESRVTNRTD